VRVFSRTVPIDLIRRLFNYNPETGALTWADDLGKYKAGKSAVVTRYRQVWGDFSAVVNIFGSSYQANRIVWAHVTGEFPIDEIDHKNRDRRDNRWSNLRRADRGQNQANTGLYSNNRAKVRGVHKTTKGRWRAMISVNGKNRHIGYFDTAAAANAAWRLAAKQVHGEFAAA